MRVTQGLWRAVAVAVTVAGSSIGMAKDPSPVVSAVGWDADCVTCTWGDCGGSGQHQALDWEGYNPDRKGHGQHSTCTTGTCCWVNPPGECWHDTGCRESFTAVTELYPQVREAVDRNDMHRIVTLMRLTDQVHLNTARSSIQLVGCDSTIVANFPVNEAEVSRLLVLQ
jgi:hypothetical protein